MTNRKEEYAKQICLFLAELLRTHRITLERAAEIAERVTQNINLIDSEEQFLGLVKTMTADFQELFNLGQRVDMHIGVNKRMAMENNVREFVITFLAKDATLALNVLQEAIKEHVGVNDLCARFPEFKQFIQLKS